MRTRSIRAGCRRRVSTGRSSGTARSCAGPAAAAFGSDDWEQHAACSRARRPCSPCCQCCDLPTIYKPVQRQHAHGLSLAARQRFCSGRQSVRHKRGCVQIAPVCLAQRSISETKSPGICCGAKILPFSQPHRHCDCDRERRHCRPVGASHDVPWAFGGRQELELRSSRCWREHAQRYVVLRMASWTQAANAAIASDLLTQRAYTVCCAAIASEGWQTLQSRCANSPTCGFVIRCREGSCAPDSVLLNGQQCALARA